MVNNNVWTLMSSNFTMTIAGVTATGFNTFAGEDSPCTDKTLTTVGTYTVTEAAVTGYTQTGTSSDCAGTIALGETKTCTITNEDDAPHLIVIKKVVNNNGGTLVSSNFTMTIDGVTATGGNSFA